MTDEDKRDIAYLISSVKSDTNKVRSEYNFPELAFRAIGTLSLALTMWIFSAVNSLQKSEASRAKDTEYLIEQVRKFEKFADQPRFTENDFNKGIVPLKDALNRNTVELNTRGTFLDETSLRLTRLELMYTDLLKRVENE